MLFGQCCACSALLLWCLLVSLASACPPFPLADFSTAGDIPDLELAAQPNNLSSLLGNVDSLDRLPKRWISVNDLGNLQAVGNPPVMHGPWPVTSCGQVVRYCYKNQHSLDNLFVMFAAAIIMWAPAYHYSSLQILPDVACRDSHGNPVWGCICGAQANGESTAEDTLIVTDGRDGPQPWSGGTQCTTGYYYQPQTPGRHVLEFGWLNVPRPAYLADDYWQAKMKATMVHELGHCIGLIHEHSRPDRDLYITFDWRWLGGVDQALVSVMNPRSPTDFTPGSTAAERIEKLMTDSRLANIYWPHLYGYMLQSLIPKWNGNMDWETDGRFDLGSMMLYGSDDYPKLSQVPGQDQRAYIQQNAQQVNGGNADPRSVRISAGDVKRVAMLYPGTPEKQQAAASMKNWGEPHGGFQIYIPGLMSVPLDLLANPVDWWGLNGGPAPP